MLTIGEFQLTSPHIILITSQEQQFSPRYNLVAIDLLIDNN